MTGSLVIAFNNYGMRYQVFLVRWVACMQRPEALQKQRGEAKIQWVRRVDIFCLESQFYLSFTDSEFMIKLLLVYDFIIFGSQNILLLGNKIICVELYTHHNLETHKWYLKPGTQSTKVAPALSPIERWWMEGNSLS